MTCTRCAVLPRLTWTVVPVYCFAQRPRLYRTSARFHTRSARCCWRRTGSRFCVRRCERRPAKSTATPARVGWLLISVDLHHHVAFVWESRRMPMSTTPNPIALMVSEVEIAMWNSNGLPADAFSVENGCIFCNTTRWPLLIDPQLQVSASSGALGQTTSRP